MVSYARVQVKSFMDIVSIYQDTKRDGTIIIQRGQYHDVSKISRENHKGHTEK